MPTEHDEKKPDSTRKHNPSQVDPAASHHHIHMSKPHAPTDRVWSKNAARKSPTKHVEQLIGVLDRATSAAWLRLQSGDLDPQEVARLRSVLTQVRTDMMTALTKLPSGSPAQLKAFAAVERVNTVIGRFDALERAHQSRAATATSVSPSSNSSHSSPTPYCDAAPQQQAPCELNSGERARYRDKLGHSVIKARENWKIAIVTQRLEERLRGDGLDFERKLGEAIFGLLFSVFTSAVKGLANIGVDKALSTRTVRDDVTMTTWKEGPSPDDVVLGKAIAGTGVDTAAPIVKGKLMTAGISAHTLNSTANASVAIPSDRMGFLAAMKTAPDAWADTILLHRDELFDADLVSLVEALPLDAPSLSLPAMEMRIKDLLDRYELQVMAVNFAPIADIRPIKIITPSGIRHALVSPEKGPNSRLQKEFHAERTRTGRWQFLRWLDDDMREMAIGRAVEQDVTGASLVRAFNDASFWSKDSLSMLSSSSPAGGA